MTEPCALCGTPVERLDLHWHDDLHAEVCHDCCPVCEDER